MTAEDGTVRLFYGETGGKRLSVTGCRCDLECAHCMSVLLNDAVDVSVRGSIADVSEFLSANGAGSVLITGGKDVGGAVPIEYAVLEMECLVSKGIRPVVRAGLISEDCIARLVKSGVRDFALDIHQDPAVITGALGLKRSPGDYSAAIDAVTEAGGNIIPRITLGFGTYDFRMSEELLISKGIRKAILDTIVPNDATCIDESVVSGEAFIQCARELKESGFDVCIGSRRDPAMGDVCTAAAESGITAIEDIDAVSEAKLTEAGYGVRRMNCHFGLD